MNDVSRIAAALAATVAVPLGLAGCATVSTDDVADAVIPAVVAADPAIADAVLTASHGVAGTGIWVRVYVDDEDPVTLARVIDAALRATLESSPVRPVDVDLDLALAPRPADVNLNVGRLPIMDLAADLGLGDDVADDVVGLSIDELEQRYGPWSEPGR